jgi:hypothetical protein
MPANVVAEQDYGREPIGFSSPCTASADAGRSVGYENLSLADLRCLILGWKTRGVALAARKRWNHAARTKALGALSPFLFDGGYPS